MRLSKERERVRDARRQACRGLFVREMSCVPPTNILVVDARLISSAEAQPGRGTGTLPARRVSFGGSCGGVSGVKRAHGSRGCHAAAPPAPPACAAEPRIHACTHCAGAKSPQLDEPRCGRCVFVVPRVLLFGARIFVVRAAAGVLIATCALLRVPDFPPPILL